MMKMRSAAVIVGVALVGTAACSSSGPGREQIKYGTPAAGIAKQLGICTHAERVTSHAVRCRFADGAIIGIDSIAGPADQQLELPAAKSVQFCELVAHGFGVTGLSLNELKAHAHVNALVAKYGGQLAGQAC